MKINNFNIILILVFLSFLTGCVAAQDESESKGINTDEELSTYAEMTGGRWHSEGRALVYEKSGIIDPSILRTLSEESLQRIRKVHATRTSLTDIPDLSFLSGLISLNLSRNEIIDLSPLTGLNLEQLNIPENPISDITPISKMQTLRSVDLTLCSIVKLPDLSSWKNLIGLGLIETPIRSLRNLETIPSDFTLNIMNCDQLTDIDSLLDARVTTLFIDELNYERLQPWFDENVEKIKEKRPQFNIRFSAGE